MLVILKQLEPDLLLLHPQVLWNLRVLMLEHHYLLLALEALCLDGNDVVLVLVDFQGLVKKVVVDDSHV